MSTPQTPDSTPVPETTPRTSTELGLMWRAFRRDPLALASLVILLLFVAGAVFAPVLAPHPGQGRGEPNVSEKFQPPGGEYLLGTDHLGRDVLSRVLYGGRSSLSVGFLVVIIAAIIGVPLGAVAGYYGGWIDNVLMRITDVFLSFPPLLLAIALSAAMGAGFINTMVAISFTWWPWYARLVRAQTLSLRERYYIEAARSIGVSDAKIIAVHVLPNVMTPVMVQMTLDLGGAILTGAAISFIGLGVQPPTADWGTMINLGRIYFVERPWFVTSAGLSIFLVVLSFNLIGDTIRDVLDPRTRRDRR